MYVSKAIVSIIIIIGLLDTLQHLVQDKKCACIVLSKLAR